MKKVLSVIKPMVVDMMDLLRSSCRCTRKTLSKNSLTQARLFEKGKQHIAEHLDVTNMLLTSQNTRSLFKYLLDARERQLMLMQRDRILCMVDSDLDDKGSKNVNQFSSENIKKLHVEKVGLRQLCGYLHHWQMDESKERELFAGIITQRKIKERLPQAHAPM